MLAVCSQARQPIAGQTVRQGGHEIFIQAQGSNADEHLQANVAGTSCLHSFVNDGRGRGLQGGPGVWGGGSGGRVLGWERGEGGG